MSSMLKKVRRANTKREATGLVKSKKFSSINVGKVEKLRKQLGRPEIANLLARLLNTPESQVAPRIAGMSIPHLTRLWDAVKDVTRQLLAEQRVAEAKQAARVDATLAPEQTVVPVPAG